MFSKIICLTNDKGGTGKTTLSAILAQSAIEAGIPVGICDLDVSQGDFLDAMTNWDCDILTDVTALEKFKKNPSQRLIIVDTPPAINGIKDTAISMADLVLIPVSHTLRSLKSVKNIASNYPVKIILNLQNPNSSLEAKIIEIAQKYFSVIGIVKQYARIRTNLTNHNAWYHGLSDVQKEPYEALLENIVQHLKTM